jgi:hypothetical protein
MRRKVGPWRVPGPLTMEQTTPDRKHAADKDA